MKEEGEQREKRTATSCFLYATENPFFIDNINSVSFLQLIYATFQSCNILRYICSHMAAVQYCLQRS